MDEKDDNSKSIDCVDEKDNNFGKTEKKTIVQSSIVAYIRTRGDHVKKRKPSIYVTPSSITKNKGIKKVSLQTEPTISPINLIFNHSTLVFSSFYYF